MSSAPEENREVKERRGESTSRITTARIHFGDLSFLPLRIARGNLDSAINVSSMGVVRNIVVVILDKSALGLDNPRRNPNG
jgi:hypothetical protein